MGSNVSVVVWHDVQYSVDVCSKLSIIVWMCECVVWCLMCGCVVHHGWTPTFCSRQSGRRRHGGNLLTEMWSEAISPSLLFLKGLHNGKVIFGILQMTPFLAFKSYQKDYWSKMFIYNAQNYRAARVFYCDNFNFWPYGIIVRHLTFQSSTYVYQQTIGPSCKSEEIMALANCVSSNWLKGG